MTQNSPIKRYENPELARLLKDHIKELKPPSMKKLYEDMAQILKESGSRITSYNTVQGHMAEMRARGSITGSAQITPQSERSLESRTHDSVDMLYIIRVDERSRMIEIIREIVREETGVDDCYWPTHIIEQVSYH